MENPKPIFLIGLPLSVDAEIHKQVQVEISKTLKDYHVIIYRNLTEEVDFSLYDIRHDKTKGEFIAKSIADVEKLILESKK